VNRQQLEDRARALGCFLDVEARTNQELADAIAAEEAAGAWLARLEQLPTDEAKRDAVHRLRLQIEAGRCEARTNGGTQCELPANHPDRHHRISDAGGWMSWTDEAMADFARAATE
jgi:hypothetical protein